MKFHSAQTKSQAQTTVNNLFANVLPGSTIASTSAKKLSSTEILNNRLSKSKLSKEEIRKINKNHKQKQNKLINKKLEENKKFAKLVRYNIIKNHKQENPQDLSVEETKYLNKLVKKNANAIKRLSEIDDESINDEIEQLKSEILDLTNDRYNRDKRYKTNQLTKKEQDFNNDIKSGAISYPGLTPGLAPVGLEDDSDDE